jgi:hypothetical protein
MTMQGLLASIWSDKINRMQIERDIIENWKSIRKWGDAKDIATQAGVSVESVYLAFRTGKASDHLFKVMTAFYMQRQSFYNHITSTLNDYE